MRARVVTGGLVSAALLVAGAAWFEPWRLLTSSTVDEQAPSSAQGVAVAGVDPSSAPTDGEGSGPGPAPTTPAVVEPPQDSVLARGPFETAEHPTSGRAVVLALADGRRFVRLEDLATSDGPDLHVWLSDQPSGGTWGSYDDGRAVRLGELKATHGNQNYEVPEGTSLDGLTSVVIWCDRFDVAFGTAPVSFS